ncbi:MAG: DASH family cryptochrome [Fulvivirga sp.]|nr:DASH family cryptochrome [Fulvivirga sp.]
MSNKIVWFKNELRLEDNEMLYAACSSGSKVLPVYIFDPRDYELISELGFQRSGPYRTKFLIESVANLRKNLKSIGGDLIVRIGHPEEIIPQLAIQSNSKQVYLAKEVTIYEKQVISRLEQQLISQGIEMVQFWQNTLLHEQDVPWPIKQVPQVFTDFRKEAESESEVRKIFPKPEIIAMLPGVEHGEIPTVENLGVQPEQADGRVVLDFKGGEDSGWKRMQTYIWEKDLLKKYKVTRNGLLGADYSSKLSPWLANGCLSPKSIYYQIKKYEDERVKNRSTYWLFFELMWRDFFKYMAKQNGADIFKLKGLNDHTPPTGKNKETFERWKQGDTGEHFVDANMVELLKTGYMSNRGRQLVASYLIHEMNIDWRWGAAWFENRLIDYDPCSNWLNWAYIAGVGNDPQGGRNFNIESQQQKYDPDGKYIDYWLKPVTQ